MPAAKEGKYLLYNSWILDGGSDTHVCNNADIGNFTIVRFAQPGEKLYIGKISYSIAAFGIARFLVDTPSGSLWMDLKDVALAPGFMTSIVSLAKLNQKDVYWNSRMPDRLEYQDGSIACYIYQKGGYLVLTSQLPSSEYATFAI
jgi:hypothetical protein